MSGFSFSHQFPKHWLNTPDAVRQCIQQELTDIVTLLQSDRTAPASEFAFTHPDLNRTLDQLLQTQQSAVTVKTASASVTSRNHTSRTHETSAASTTPVPAQPAPEAVPTTAHPKQDSSNSAQEEQTDNEATSLSAEHLAIIDTLEARVEDYLSDQMAVMAQDIKDWLREEVKRQLKS